MTETSSNPRLYTSRRERLLTAIAWIGIFALLINFWVIERQLLGNVDFISLLPHILLLAATTCLIVLARTQAAITREQAITPSPTSPAASTSHPTDAQSSPPIRPASDSQNFWHSAIASTLLQSAHAIQGLIQFVEESPKQHLSIEDVANAVEKLEEEKNYLEFLANALHHLTIANSDHRAASQDILFLLKQTIHRLVSQLESHNMDCRLEHGKGSFQAAYEESALRYSFRCMLQLALALGKESSTIHLALLQNQSHECCIRMIFSHKLDAEKANPSSVIYRATRHLRIRDEELVLHSIQSHLDFLVLDALVKNLGGQLHLASHYGNKLEVELRLRSDTL